MPSVTLTVDPNGDLSSSNQSVATTSGHTATFVAPTVGSEIYTVTFVPSTGNAFADESHATISSSPPHPAVNVSPSTPEVTSSQCVITFTDSIPSGSSNEHVSCTIPFMEEKAVVRKDPTMIFQPPG